MTRSPVTRRVLDVAGREIALNRADKILFPDAGITKADVVDYYLAVAHRMLPLIRDRPLTLQRFPDGIGEDGFYQKEASDHFPDWLPRAALPKEDGVVQHVVANDAAALAYLATQGTITMHAALSRVDRPRKPDRIVFDLDPPDGPVDRRLLPRLRKAALNLRALLEDELGLRCLAMTTGSSGFHVVVPIARHRTFAGIRSFARGVASALAERDPDRLTLAQRKAKRGDRIFVDVLRNAYGQTAVAPYSLRPRPGAPVALPIAWSEIDAVEPRSFHLRDVPALLEQRPDPWDRTVDEPQIAGPAIEKLRSISQG